jgi:hypothetical protein
MDDSIPMNYLEMWMNCLIEDESDNVFCRIDISTKKMRILSI